MNKNSNTYQILYAAVMVLLVGSLLALIYMALKPKQNENIANDTRKQILSALHIAAPDDSQVKETYEKYISSMLRKRGCVRILTHPLFYFTGLTELSISWYPGA